MGKGTYRVTQSNLRFFTFLVLQGMISALESGLFIGHKIIINICRTLNTFFSKQYLDTIDPFSHAFSHCHILWIEEYIIMIT